MPYFFAYVIAWVIAASGAVTVFASLMMFKFAVDAVIPAGLGAAGSLGKYLMPLGVFVAGFVLMGIGQLIQSVIDTARHTGELLAEVRATRKAAVSAVDNADTQGY